MEVFFVRKKNGQLRMVIDCRSSNCYFDQPADDSLCSGDALGRIELEADEQLHITSADLKDAFYHLLLPEKLRKYFGSRCVSARDLGITCINGEAIPPHTLLRPLGWQLCQWGGDGHCGCASRSTARLCSSGLHAHRLGQLFHSLV